MNMKQEKKTFLKPTRVFNEAIQRQTVKDIQAGKCNTAKPHSSLHMETPAECEAQVKKLPKSLRPKEEIYKGYSEVSTKKELLTKRER